MSTRRSFLASAALAPLLAADHPVVAAQATPAAAPPVTTEADVTYGTAGGETLLLDVYRPPAREQPRPAVLLFHGGGLMFGDRTDVADQARNLAAAGYVAFAVDYRLFSTLKGTTTNTWPAQFDDAQRALRWVRANAATYGVDPTRIAAYGHSSGGYLAALLGVRETRDTSDPALAEVSSRATCVVALAGDMDLTIPPPAVDDQAMTTAWLGGTAAQRPDVYRDASPLTWVDATTAPFLIMHNGDDELVPVENARRMVAALQVAAVDVAFVANARGGHDRLGIWPFSGAWILTFLASQLHPAL